MTEETINMYECIEPFFVPTIEVEKRSLWRVKTVNKFRVYLYKVETNEWLDLPYFYIERYFRKHCE